MRFGFRLCIVIFFSPLGCWRSTAPSASDTGSDTETFTADDTDADTLPETDRRYYGPCRIDWWFWEAPGETWFNQDNYDYDIENDRITSEFLFEGVMYTRLITDVEGRVYLDEVDNHYDGEIDHRTTYEYDEFGNEILSIYTDVEGEIFTNVTTYDYDAQGRVRSKALETNEAITDYSYIYNNDGYLEHVTSDTDKDGTVDAAWDRTYDIYGNAVWCWYDDEYDGIVDSEWGYEYTYDENGNILTYAYDTNGDGRNEWRRVYEYNGAGDPTREQIDYNDDGVWEWITTYVYDDKGGLLTGTRRRGTGALSLVDEFEYDGFGNLTFKTSTNYDDGGDVTNSVEGVYFYDCWW